MMFLGAEEKRGLGEEKRGPSGVKAALQIPLPRNTKQKSHALQVVIDEDGSKTSLTRSISI